MHNSVLFLMLYFVNTLNELNLKYLLSFIVVWLSVVAFSQEDSTRTINGLSLVSERFVLDSTHMKPIADVNANYAAVIPFCFMPSLDTGLVMFNNKHQWVGEGLDGSKAAIRTLHKSNVEVMLKPQIWVGHGAFTGEIEMKTEENWILFEEQYAAYILAFAKLAESENVSMLCIGTELGNVVKQRPQLFFGLIEQVKEVYSGKLTYAENWDCFASVPFWSELDYIGVDAYFPITKKAKPSIDKLKEGWERYIPIFDSLSAHFDRKILFTEFGYRSVQKCSVEPWGYNRIDKSMVDEKCQMKALKALFMMNWEQDYFAGGFLWKWHPNHEKAGGSKNQMFTVQNKESEDLIRTWYGR